MIASFGSFVVDSSQRRLTCDAAEVHLTPKAFDLLLLLLEESPRVLRKSELHERLWPRTFVSDAALVGLVKELRRVLRDSDGSVAFIRTAHRIGYAFVGRVEKAAGRRQGITRWIVAGGRRIVLADGENLIGRDPASAVRLDAFGVSRRHARIVIDGPRVALEDLGSKNGTTVRGSPVDGEADLRDGDEIWVGPVLILFRAEASGASTETITPGARRRPPPSGGTHGSRRG